MNGGDLGPGWREVSYVEYRDDDGPADRTATVRIGDEDPHYFIRNEPLPTLPAAPYTVIRVTWDTRQGYASDVLIRLPEGRYHDWSFGGDDGDGFGSTEQLRREITSFEVLAEPRAVTAKALMLRLETLRDGDGENWREQILREFGADS